MLVESSIARYLETLKCLKKETLSENIQVSFPNVGSKQKNVHTEYHGIFIIQKSGLPKTWEYYCFVILFPCFGKDNFFLITLT